MKSFLSLLLTLLILPPAYAGDVRFSSAELFRIPFGAGRGELGTAIDDKGFRFPHEFTRDARGRFYINDLYKHRIVRYSAEGAYELSLTYPKTATKVFSHADEDGNIWLLVADPTKGFYYGVHDEKGKPLRSAVFSQYQQFRLSVGDDFNLRVVLSSDKKPDDEAFYQFDIDSLLLKKDPSGRPPSTHHRVRTQDGLYFIDQVTDGAKEDHERSHRVSDASGRKLGTIEGRVLYTTARGEVYTRLGARDLRVYSASGRLLTKVRLSGLSATTAFIRFNESGDLFQLDGIPDRTVEEVRAGGAEGDPRTDQEDLQFSPKMTGLRMVQWHREQN